MPLTRKGNKILRSMKKTYKSDKKAKSIFYAMINEGKLTGVEHAKGKAKKGTAKKRKAGNRTK